MQRRCYLEHRKSPLGLSSDLEDTNLRWNMIFLEMMFQFLLTIKVPKKENERVGTSS